MDIRELRIDDRVSHNGDIGKVIEIKTTHVRLMFKDGTSYLYNVNELEPIPITDKWLERLGFGPIFSGNYHKQIDSFDLRLISLVKGYSIEIADCCLGNMICDKNIKYIHQLQHELFDAGVELKIEL